MVILSWCLPRPGTDPRPGKIETSGFHHMIAWSLRYFVTKSHASGSREQKGEKGHPLKDVILPLLARLA